MSQRNANKEENKEKNQEQGSNENNTNQEGSTSGGSANPRYNELVRRASYINTFHRAGTALPIEGAQITARRGVSSSVGYVPSSIMVFDFIPTVGVSKTTDSPVNMAAREEYSFIRHANSGSRNYEAPDLMLYYLGMGDAFSFYDYMQRLYAIINTYQVLNAAYPKAIFTALGADYDSFVNNQPNFLFYMQQYRAKLQQFALPVGLEIFKNHRDLNTKIFRDGDDIKSQMYIFNQKYFYTFKVIDQAKGLTLKSAANDQGVITYASLTALGNEIISSMADSADIAMISGDVLKAYGEVALSVLPDVTDAIEVTIAKDEGILKGINNMAIVPVSHTSARIYDNRDGTLRCMPLWTNGPANSPTGTINHFNFIESEPTPDDVIAAMRFHPSVTVTPVAGSDATEGVVDSCSTEIVTACKVVTLEESAIKSDLFGVIVQNDSPGDILVEYEGITINPGIGQVRNIPQFIRCGTTSVTGWSETDNANIGEAFDTLIDGITAKIQSVVNTVRLVSVFDWHPMFYITGNTSETGNQSLVASTHLLGDYQNAVYVSDDDISALHEASLFYYLFS